MPDDGSRHDSIKILLGFDVGEKSIGVAVGQIVTQLATPLIRLPAQDAAPNWQNVKNLIDTWNPDHLIVGLPLHMDGKEQKMTKIARRFGNRLQGRFALPIIWVDERLSSHEADARLKALNINAENDKLNLDSISAQILIEQWFQEYREKK